MYIYISDTMSPHLNAAKPSLLYSGRIIVGHMYIYIYIHIHIYIYIYICARVAQPPPTPSMVWCPGLAAPPHHILSCSCNILFLFY